MIRAIGRKTQTRVHVRARSREGGGGGVRSFTCNDLLVCNCKSMIYSSPKFSPGHDLSTPAQSICAAPCFALLNAFNYMYVQLHRLQLTTSSCLCVIHVIAGEGAELVNSTTVLSGRSGFSGRGLVGRLTPPQVR